MEHGASVSVEEQSHMEMTMKTEVEAAATSTAHFDIEMEFNHSKQEPGLVRSVKSEPALLVKEEILEDGSQAGNEQHCVQGTTTPAGTIRLNEDCSTSLSDLFNVKHEVEEMEIGPTVFQHMDIHYTINKNMSAGTGENTIVDEATPCSGVKKESLEDKLRGSCKNASQKITEDEDDEAHVNCQQMNLQQHCLRQQHKTRLNFQCDRTICKPDLLSAHNKVNSQNIRKNSMMTSSIIGAGSNQNRGDSAKQKRKVCDKGNSSKAAKFHSSLHRVEKPVRCDSCDVIFAYKCHLIRHMTVHTGEKPCQCDVCGSRFSQKGSLKQHMRVHTGEKPFQCTTCGAKFARSYDLTKHRRVHTGEKPYQCTTCGARFSGSSAISKHMRVHTGEKPYKCDRCGARFAQSGTLISHMRVHTGEKPYLCTICNAKFAESSSVTKHMRVHTGEKRYKCDVCDVRFTKSSGLTRHMSVHTGEKFYPCDMCGEKFRLSSGLTQHVRVHTGDKPYLCTITRLTL